MNSICSLVLLAISFLTANLSFAQTTRQPEVAGSFYPADPIVLSDTIDSYFRATKKDVISPTPVLAIIAPHAGYQFSGSVAAHAYAQVAGRNYKTVIILGPSHKGGFNGIAMHSALYWQTPLGKLRVDTALEHLLARDLPFLQVRDTAFNQEHSIEDQIPFIQKSLGEVLIIPLACGTLRVDEMVALSRALSDALLVRRGELLLVASSDMSHYLGARQTFLRDSVGVSDVASMDIDKLLKDLQSGITEYCGFSAVLSTMLMAERFGADARFLAYSNSSVATRDTNRVIGYGAFAFEEPDYPKPLTDSEKHTLISLARETIDTVVIAHRTPSISLKDTALFTKEGAFVTLFKKGELRGCIGYIPPTVPLAKTVYDMAQAACEKDPRFTPVTKDELKDIKIEISVLSRLRRIRNISDIVVGTHGLYIAKGKATGLLLPQVATQNKWSTEEFVKQVALKAGLKEDDWKAEDSKIYTFTSQVFGE